MKSPAGNIEFKSPFEAGYARPEGFQRSHDFQKKLVRAALMAAVALASICTVSAHDVAAGSFSTAIQVNAVVLARTQLRSLLQPAALVVTETDVQRGYVEVSGASILEIWNNNPAGCDLTFEPSDFPFREADVSVMGRDIIIYPTGGMIVIPGSGRQQVALDYRFVLTDEAQPGSYAWPLSVSVNPR